jgi:multiple sugar transport system permease protein
LWFWLFDQQVGLFNQLLVDLGVLARPMVWLSQEQRALWAVIISVVWKVVGFSMILFVASIQSVPHEITDAAKVDGANYFQRVWRIILPMTSRTVVLVTLITIIGSMLAFDQFYIMTYGGPRNTTITSVYWIYTNSFTYFKLGYGAALSVFLTVLICLGAALQLSLARRGSET